MRPHDPTRRRAITILAGAAAGLASGGGAPVADPVEHEWRGVAMGADARILFSGVSPDLVRDCVAVAISEIDRLEQALSLFRDESEICRLNRYGSLPRPSGDMRRALGLALTVARASGGLFDPTVQALWESYVDWFSRAPEAGLPPASVVAAARAAVDWRAIVVAADGIALGRGQRITLNGMGQGYVTDRVAELFRARGLQSVLVDLGEQRALGPRCGREPWYVERTRAAPIGLVNGALATSEGAGCVLGAGGAAHHLFDPRSGRSANHWTRVTVHHACAAIADALSTTLYVATPEEIDRLIWKFEGITVWATDREGRELCWSSHDGAGDWMLLPRRL